MGELPVEHGVKLFIHPSHRGPGDPTQGDPGEAALGEYERRIETG
jgi:hypothetical protein